jgi:hypothetical protein
MESDTAWLLVGAAIWSLFVLWAWRRLESKQLEVARYRAPPGEPCWTEQISTDGRLSYGRYRCYHSELAEMEARMRMGEFGASG